MRTVRTSESVRPLRAVRVSDSCRVNLSRKMGGVNAIRGDLPGEAVPNAAIVTPDSKRVLPVLMLIVDFNP
jgi:hypothetical protein